MPPEPTLPESLALIEGLTMHSLSDWLQVGTHYVNMSQAQCTDDDAEAVPPTLTIWFQGQTVRAHGADRLKVLIWLAAQVEEAPSFRDAA